MNFKIGSYFRIVFLIVLVGVLIYHTQKLLKNNALGKKSSRPLIVGMMAGYAPFMTINKHGEYEGFDVDIVQELSERIGRSVKYRVMDLAELLFALGRKKIDLLVSGLTMTPGRIKRFDMVHYHGGGQNTVPVAFWDQVPEGIKTFDDLAKMGLRVVVESGSSWDDCAEAMGLTKTKGFGHYHDMLLEIKHGKSDAVLFDPDIVGLYSSKFPELKIVQLPLEGKFKILGLGIGVHKSTPELSAVIAKIIEQMREDGTLAKLESKWGLN